jgi:hypothetical protein
VVVLLVPEPVLAEAAGLALEMPAVLAPAEADPPPATEAVGLAPEVEVVDVVAAAVEEHELGPGMNGLAAVAGDAVLREPLLLVREGLAALDAEGETDAELVGNGDADDDAPEEVAAADEELVDPGALAGALEVVAAEPAVVPQAANATVAAASVKNRRCLKC